MEWFFNIVLFFILVILFVWLENNCLKLVLVFYLESVFGIKCLILFGVFCVVCYVLIFYRKVMDVFLVF